MFCFVAGFSVSAFAQETCPQFTNTSNILLNLQLGMTAVDVTNKLGKALKIKVKKDEDYRFFQNYIDKKPPPNLNGVRAIYLRFFEKKLYQIEIFYEENKYPSAIKSFTGIISTELNLPASDWKFANRQAVLKCSESSLTADYQLNPRIELTNETVRTKVDEINKKTK